jgi:hypothetical protein
MKTQKYVMVLLTVPTTTVKQAYILDKKFKLIETIGEAFNEKGDFQDSTRTIMKKYGFNDLKNIQLGSANNIDEYIQTVLKKS